MSNVDINALRERHDFENTMRQIGIDERRNYPDLTLSEVFKLLEMRKVVCTNFVREVNNEENERHCRRQVKEINERIISLLRLFTPNLN